MSTMRLLWLAGLAGVSMSAHAVERYHQSTLKWIYPTADGNFVLGFDNDSSYCSSGQTPKYMYVTVGQNSVTVDGSKKMYAAALVAFSTKTPLAIAFDDATSNCYVNRVTVTN